MEAEGEEHELDPMEEEAAQFSHQAKQLTRETNQQGSIFHVLPPPPPLPIPTVGLMREGGIEITFFCIFKLFIEFYTGYFINLVRAIRSNW